MPPNCRQADWLGHKKSPCSTLGIICQSETRRFPLYKLFNLSSDFHVINCIALSDSDMTKQPKSLSEHLTYPFDTGYQRIDFFFGIVQSQRGTYRTFNAHPVHQRLGTMMSRAHGYA